MSPPSHSQVYWIGAEPVAWHVTSARSFSVAWTWVGWMVMIGAAAELSAGGFF